YQRLAPILGPFLGISSFLVVMAGLAGVLDGVHWLNWSLAQQLLMIAALLLVSRAQSSMFTLLVAFIQIYEATHRGALPKLNLDAQVHLLAMPWRIAAFALLMVLLTQAGRWLHARRKELVVGSFGQPFFTARSIGWIFLPALILSFIAPLYHTFD